MIFLSTVPIGAALVFCLIQWFATKNKEKKGIYRITLTIWASLAILWILSATVMPDSYFSILSTIPEGPHIIEDGMEVYLVLSLIFAPTYLISSVVLIAITERRRNKSNQAAHTTPAIAPR